jgi:hypothetical protein
MFKAVWGGLVVLALLAAPARAQDQIATGTLTSTTCPGSGCVELAVAGAGTGGIQIAGTWTATPAFFGAINCVDFAPLQVSPIAGGAAVTDAGGANGSWLFSAAGLCKVRVKAASYTSGTASVAIRVSHGTALSPSSSSSGGGLTDAELRATPVDVNLAASAIAVPVIGATPFTTSILDSITFDSVRARVATPLAGDAGLVTRNIPSGTQTVSGAVSSSPATMTQSGTITSGSNPNDRVVLTCSGVCASASLEFVASGGSTGDLSFEVSTSSGTNYFPLEGVNPYQGGSQPIAASTNFNVATTPSGLWRFPLPTGTTNVRMRANSWGSGSWAIKLDASSLPAQLAQSAGVPLVTAPTSPANQATIANHALYTSQMSPQNGSPQADVITQTDAAAQPNYVPYNWSLPMLYNGATWDRWRGDATFGAFANVKGWFGSAAPTVGQKAMAASIPVTFANNQSALPIAATRTHTTMHVSGTTGTGTELSVEGYTVAVLEVASDQVGSSALSFEALATSGGNWFPIYGERIGSGLLEKVTTGPTDLGNFVFNVAGLFSIRANININPGSGTHFFVEGYALYGAGPNAIPTIQGASVATVAQAWWQQISDGTTGPVAVKAASTAAVASDKAMVVAVHPSTLVNVNLAAMAPALGLATDATLTGGTQKAIVRGGAKGATAAADITSTAEGADHQAIDVQNYHGAVAIDPRSIRALTSSDVVDVSDRAGRALGSIANTTFGVTNWLGSAAPTIGQKLMASSLPVTLASDQPAIPVSGTVSTKTALTANAPATGSIGVSSAALVASNGSRKGLVVVNVSNATCSLAVGATAVLNSGITLQAGAVWNMNEYSFATGAINAICSAASSTLTVQEFQ